MCARVTSAWAEANYLFCARADVCVCAILQRASVCVRACNSR